MNMPAAFAAQPPPQQAPADLGNNLLGETPSLMITSLVDTPAGQRLLLTIRTATTTLTVFLSGSDAKTWAANLSANAGRMSSAGLVAANGNLPKPKLPGG